MFEIVCVSDRRLCDDFLSQIEKIAAGGIDTLVLREKDLSPAAYAELAAEVTVIASNHGVPCVLHSFTDVLGDFPESGLHLPFSSFQALLPEERRAIPAPGVSCHSLEEARFCAATGAAYVTVGHIYATTCKEGLPPRGLSFLEEICRAIPLPVYAVGGIGPDNIGAVAATGATGAWIRSGLMTAADPRTYINKLREELANDDL